MMQDDGRSEATKAMRLSRIQSTQRKLDNKLTRKACDKLIRTLYFQIDADHDLKMTRIEMHEVLSNWGNVNHAKQMLEMFWPADQDIMEPEDWVRAWDKVATTQGVESYKRLCYWLQVVVNETMVKSAQKVREYEEQLKQWVHVMDKDGLSMGWGSDPAWGLSLTRQVSERQEIPLLKSPELNLKDKTSFGYKQVLTLWNLLDDATPEGDETKGDDMLSDAELNMLTSPAYKNTFDNLDKNGDGIVCATEWVNFWEERLQTLGKSRFTIDLYEATERTKLIKEAFNEASQLDEKTLEAFNNVYKTKQEEEMARKQSHYMIGAAVVAAVAVSVGLVMWLTRK
jgi:hypothetical protein